MPREYYKDATCARLLGAPSTTASVAEEIRHYDDEHNGGCTFGCETSDGGPHVAPLLE